MRLRAQGFTLIELIIGLTLISMAFTIAFAALRLATRSMERTDQLVGELEEVRIVQTVVQTYLAQARPLRNEAAEMRVDFRGDGQQLEFVAPVPVQQERLAGLYRYRLSLTEQADGKALVLDYEPYRPGTVSHWSAGHESTVLMSNISTGEFSYFSSSVEKGDSWHDTWQDAEQMPRMVKIVLQHGQSMAEPVELVVALAAGSPR